MDTGAGSEKRLRQRHRQGELFDFGQGSPWQDFAGCLYPVEDAILMTYDDPD